MFDVYAQDKNNVSIFSSEDCKENENRDLIHSKESKYVGIAIKSSKEKKKNIYNLIIANEFEELTDKDKKLSNLSLKFPIKNYSLSDYYQLINLFRRNPKIGKEELVKYKDFIDYIEKTDEKNMYENKSKKILSILNNKQSNEELKTSNGLEELANHILSKKDLSNDINEEVPRFLRKVDNLRVIKSKCRPEFIISKTIIDNDESIDNLCDKNIKHIGISNNSKNDNIDPENGSEYVIVLANKVEELNDPIIFEKEPKVNNLTREDLLKEINLLRLNPDNEIINNKVKNLCLYHKKRNNTNSENKLASEYTNLIKANTNNLKSLTESSGLNNLAEYLFETTVLKNKLDLSKLDSVNSPLKVDSIYSKDEINNIFPRFIRKIKNHRISIDLGRVDWLSGKIIDNINDNDHIFDHSTKFIGIFTKMIGKYNNREICNGKEIINDEDTTEPVNLSIIITSNDLEEGFLINNNGKNDFSNIIDDKEDLVSKILRINKSPKTYSDDLIKLKNLYQNIINDNIKAIEYKSINENLDNMIKEVQTIEDKNDNEKLTVRSYLKYFLEDAIKDMKNSNKSIFDESYYKIYLDKYFKSVKGLNLVLLKNTDVNGPIHSLMNNEYESSLTSYNLNKDENDKCLQIKDRLKSNCIIDKRYKNIGVIKSKNDFILALAEEIDEKNINDILKINDVISDDNVINKINEYRMNSLNILNDFDKEMERIRLEKDNADDEKVKILNDLNKEKENLKNSIRKSEFIRSDVLCNLSNDISKDPNINPEIQLNEKYNCKPINLKSLKCKKAIFNDLIIPNLYNMGNLHELDDEKSKLIGINDNIDNDKDDNKIILIADEIIENKSENDDLLNSKSVKLKSKTKKRDHKPDEKTTKEFQNDLKENEIKFDDDNADIIQLFIKEKLNKKEKSKENEDEVNNKSINKENDDDEIKEVVFESPSLNEDLLKNETQNDLNKNENDNNNENEIKNKNNKNLRAKVKASANKDDTENNSDLNDKNELINEADKNRKILEIRKKKAQFTINQTLPKNNLIDDKIKEVLEDFRKNPNNYKERLQNLLNDDNLINNNCLDKNKLKNIINSKELEENKNSSNYNYEFNNTLNQIAKEIHDNIQKTNNINLSIGEYNPLSDNFKNFNLSNNYIDSLVKLHCNKVNGLNVMTDSGDLNYILSRLFTSRTQDSSDNNFKSVLDKKCNSIGVYYNELNNRVILTAEEIIDKNDNDIFEEIQIYEQINLLRSDKPRLISYFKKLLSKNLPNEEKYTVIINDLNNSKILNKASKNLEISDDLCTISKDIMLQDCNENNKFDNLYTLNNFSQVFMISKSIRTQDIPYFMLEYLKEVEKNKEDDILSNINNELHTHIGYSIKNNKNSDFKDVIVLIGQKNNDLVEKNTNNEIIFDKSQYRKGLMLKNRKYSEFLDIINNYRENPENYVKLFGSSESILKANFIEFNNENSSKQILNNNKYNRLIINKYLQDFIENVFATNSNLFDLSEEERTKLLNSEAQRIFQNSSDIFIYNDLGYCDESLLLRLRLKNMNLLQESTSVALISLNNYYPNVKKTICLYSNKEII